MLFISLIAFVLGLMAFRFILDMARFAMELPSRAVAWLCALPYNFVSFILKSFLCSLIVSVLCGRLFSFSFSFIVLLAIVLRTAGLLMSLIEFGLSFPKRVKGFVRSIPSRCLRCVLWLIGQIIRFVLYVAIKIVLAALWYGFVAVGRINTCMLLVAFKILITMSAQCNVPCKVAVKALKAAYSVMTFPTTTSLQTAEVPAALLVPLDAAECKDEKVVVTFEELFGDVAATSKVTLSSTPSSVATKPVRKVTKSTRKVRKAT